MDETQHKLILDYHLGTIQARCSCGAWHKVPVSTQGQKLRKLSERIEDEHFRHVEEAECKQDSTTSENSTTSA